MRRVLDRLSLQLAAFLLVGAMVPSSASAATTTVVIPTGVPAVDVANVQSAVDAASTGDVVVLGAGVFDFGVDGEVDVSTAVTIEGEVSAGQLGTKVVGGSIAFDVLAPVGTVTIRNLWFEDPQNAAIRLRDTNGVVITGNKLRGSAEYGIHLASGDGDNYDTEVRSNDLRGFSTAIGVEHAVGTVVSHNIFDGNGLGISDQSPDSLTTNNVFVGPTPQYSATGSSGRVVEGNFWSDYWGDDIDGDGIGDTELAHLGVDAAPLVDPSVAERYGAFMCADWWLLWSGGWSPVEVGLTAPGDLRIDRSVNEIGDHGYYMETVRGDETLIRIMVHRPCVPESGVGPYILDMVALADLDFDLTVTVTEAGEDRYREVYESEPLAEGETRNIGVELTETIDPDTGDVIVTVEPVDVDSDGDGVPDTDDVCPGTTLDDPPDRIKNNRYYADANGDFIDLTGTWSGYTVTDTGGCDEDQIIDALDLGIGHSRFGITRSALQDWLAQL